MSHTLNVEIVENGQTAFSAEVAGPLELGRQRTGEPDPYVLLPAAPDRPARLLVVRQPEGNVARQHARLEPTPAGAVRVENLSPLALEFEFGAAIAPQSFAERAPPFTLLIGGRSIRIDHGDSVDAQGMRSLQGAAIGPGVHRPGLTLALPAALSGQTLAALIGWLQTTLGVLQSTIGAADFLQRTVEAMVTIVGLDSGRALLFEGESWKTLAAHPDSAGKWQPSRRVLEQVRRQKRTFWQEPSPTALDQAASLVHLQTVVAAPLLAPDGQVIGALYGERQRDGLRPQRQVGKLEAVLVDLLACGVATGLARQQQERAALQARICFEQFFTPELARHLEREPNLLDGRDADVTLLFCDVRGFSRISERLGPSATVRWLGAVMDELSSLVLAEGGVLVDYIGDELMAMWGAPDDQPDHAQRAIRSALAFVEALPRLNQKWQANVGEVMGVGIGLNTGTARVGNTGSQYKFKYGPLGHAVNLASRVQGLTKYLKSQLLITAATRDRLQAADYIMRRVVAPGSSTSASPSTSMRSNGPVAGSVRHSSVPPRPRWTFWKPVSSAAPRRRPARCSRNTRATGRCG